MYILVGSITTAMRLKRLLERIHGIPADVVQTPSAIKHGGCSYSVRTNAPNALSRVKLTEEEYGINIKKIYVERRENGERVYDVVP